MWAAAVEIGMVLEGWDRIRVLRERSGLRFFSFSTAVSRYGSRTHLTLALMKVRVVVRRRGRGRSLVAEWVSAAVGMAV